jgi:hypothetical protein
MQNLERIILNKKNYYIIFISSRTFRIVSRIAPKITKNLPLYPPEEPPEGPESEPEGPESEPEVPGSEPEGPKGEEGPEPPEELLSLLSLLLELSLSDDSSVEGLLLVSSVFSDPEGLLLVSSVFSDPEGLLLASSVLSVPEELLLELFSAVAVAVAVLLFSDELIGALGASRSISSPSKALFPLSEGHRGSQPGWGILSLSAVVFLHSLNRSIHLLSISCRSFA